MNNIFGKLSELSSFFANIKSTTEMQVEKSGMILNAIRNIMNMTNEVKSESGNIKRDSASINKIIKDLTAASDEVGNSVSLAQHASTQIAQSFSMARKIVDGKIISRPGHSDGGEK
jgi:methyl-accepting chemotaxis protein